MEKVWHARAERQTRKMQQTYWYGNIIIVELDIIQSFSLLSLLY